jgi:hypothetical protein
VTPEAAAGGGNSTTMELLGKLVQVAPRKLWNSEAQDFTPWIANNIAMLGEALGLDFELSATEVPVGDFACDIVARETGSSRTVIIEPLLDELREKYKFTNARAAQPMSWYAFRSGVSGCLLSSVFASGKRLRSEVYIDTGDREKNKSIFDFLLSNKDVIQTEIGEQLDWERLDERRACRIAAVRHNTSIEDAAL